MKYEDVKVAFEELKSEKIVNTINPGDGAALFKIVSDMDNLGRIMKKFEGDPEKKYMFMASIFVESLFGGRQFIDFLTDRFYLSIDDRQRENLLLLSRVFPSVLSMILFRYNDDFKNNYEQIEQSSLSQEEKEVFRDRQAKIFMGEILSETYLDMLNIPNKYLDSKGVRGFTIENGVKLATDNGLVIDLTDRQSFYLGKAAGVIKPGQLVAGGIDTIWKMAMALMDLREYNNAIEYFEKAISLSSGNDNYLVGAWNNKGVCYLRMT